ncbi:MAG: hypothetical protein JOY78_17655 [Pseudonocardia sp.]|nr:hypothetical protein [Pseudonocardia sp.]
MSRAKTATVTAALDGFSLAVNYTPPATSTGSLNPTSGCTTQAPYYNPPGASPGPDHSPGYNGACALLRVSTDAAGGSFPRVLTMWGTVYAPSNALDVPVDVMTVPVFNRGVVARMMMLGYNVANSAIVPITTTPAAGVVQANRVMTLTATISGTSTSVTATVRLCDTGGADGCASPANTGDPVAQILSWKDTR